MQKNNIKIKFMIKHLRSQTKKKNYTNYSFYIIYNLNLKLKHLLQD